MQQPTLAPGKWVWCYLTQMKYSKTSYPGLGERFADRLAAFGQCTKKYFGYMYMAIFGPGWPMMDRGLYPTVYGLEVLRYFNRVLHILLPSVLLS